MSYVKKCQDYQRVFRCLERVREIRTIVVSGREDGSEFTFCRLWVYFFATFTPKTSAVGTLG